MLNGLVQISSLRQQLTVGLFEMPRKPIHAVLLKQGLPVWLCILLLWSSTI